MAATIHYDKYLDSNLIKLQNKNWQHWSSRSQVHFKICVHKNFAIFKREQLCWTLFNKFAGVKTYNVIKKVIPTQVLSREYIISISKYTRKHDKVKYIPNCPT